MLNRISCWLTAVLLVANVHAQQLRFKHITSEEGLSTNFVKCILQDEKGFMWFGTQDGLNVYDGFQFRIYKNDPTDPASLANSDITALYQSGPGVILIGTNGGINFFNPITGHFSRPDLGKRQPPGRVNCFY